MNIKNINLMPVAELKKTVKRFPLSALCSFFLCGLMVLSIHEVIKVDEKIELYGRLMTLSAYGFFWFGLARLFAEGLGWDKTRELAVGFGVFAVLALLVFFGKDYTLVWILTLMIPALLLGISIGPYIRNNDDLSFWVYNRQTWQGAGVALSAGMLWGLGISAALGAIDYLFGVSVKAELYGDIWSVVLIIFAPLYALSWVPEKFSYTTEDVDPTPQLLFMLNWVLAPLVFVYMLILYAYFIKIAFMQELPRGQLSYMVTAFGGLGVLTYLAGWPFRESGGVLLKLLYKIFFPALIIPVIVQGISIYMRLEQYGLTEQRYLVAVSSLWFGIVALAYTFKKPSLKFMVGLLVILLAAISLGPFSAPSVSMHSQIGRLEAQLVRNGILVDGKIVRTEKEIPFEDRKAISSGLDFLSQRGSLERIRGWFPEIKAGQEISYPADLMPYMGFNYVSPYESQQTQAQDVITLNGKALPELLKLDGFEYLLSSQSIYSSSEPQDAPVLKWEKTWETTPTLSGRYQDGHLIFSVEGRGSVDFDVLGYVLAELEKDITLEARDLVMEQEKDGVRVRLMLQYGYLQKKNPQDLSSSYVFQSLTFQPLVGFNL
jgi:hypothetical protein